MCRPGEQDSNIQRSSHGTRWRAARDWPQSMKVEHVLVMRATQPERCAQLEEAGELTADERCP